MRIPVLLILPWAVALAALAALPASTPSPPAGWTALAAASPVFLQQGGSGWVPGPAGGSGRSHLPNSTLPHTIHTCSVDETDSAPCSTRRRSGSVPCTAHMDGGNVCSALIDGAGPNPLGECSTLHGKGVCSVLKPPRGLGGSYCSSVTRSLSNPADCSVLGPGKNASCSAQNPVSLPFNECSAFAPFFGVQVMCSVRRGGPSRIGYCSSGFPVGSGNPVECSTTGGSAECSVVSGNRGICSALKGADLGSCSAHPAGFCSVIGGSPGLYCRGP